MEPKSEDTKFALYAVDAIFLAGIVMGPAYFSVGQPVDGLVSLIAAALGAAFSIHQGQPWPGWAFLYGRRYL